MEKEMEVRLLSKEDICKKLEIFDQEHVTYRQELSTLVNLHVKAFSKTTVYIFI